jgi:hypothetical protein
MDAHTRQSADTSRRDSEPQPTSTLAHQHQNLDTSSRKRKFIGGTSSSGTSSSSDSDNLGSKSHHFVVGNATSCGDEGISSKSYYHAPRRVNSSHKLRLTGSTSPLSGVGTEEAPTNKAIQGYVSQLGNMYFVHKGGSSLSGSSNTTTSTNSSYGVSKERIISVSCRRRGDADGEDDLRDDDDDRYHSTSSTSTTESSNSGSNSGSNSSSSNSASMGHTSGCSSTTDDDRKAIINISSCSSSSSRRNARVVDPVVEASTPLDDFLEKQDIFWNSVGSFWDTYQHLVDETKSTASAVPSDIAEAADKWARYQKQAIVSKSSRR